MKFFLIIVYIFFLLINSILVNDTQLSSCNESFDINSYQMNENEKENNNTDEINITQAFQFLAPSYFTLVIEEIIPSFKYLISNSSCLEQYFKFYMHNNWEQISDLIKYSAKYFPDFGDEEGCISNNKNKNNEFILFAVKYNIHNYKNYTGKFKLLPFISNGFSFYGLCIKNKPECTDELIKNIQKIFNSKNGTLNGIEDYKLSVFTNSRQESSGLIKIIHQLFFWIIYIFYIVFRIIIWIIGSRFFKEKDENILKKDNKEEDSSSSSDEEEEGEESNELNIKSIKDENKNLIEKMKLEKMASKKNIYPRFYALYKICSFAKGFEILFKKEGNKYFNENDLYFILFFRFIALLSKVFIHNLYFIVRNPSKEIINSHFFNYPLVVFIKFSSFSDIIIIIIESMLVSYKLMSFIRKYTEKNSQPSFKLFFKFFLRIIPSIITNLFVFVFLYLFNDFLIKILDFFNSRNLERTKTRHLIENVINCKFCVKYYKSLIPFYMHYKNYNDQEDIENNCFQFMIVMLNLFYCYCFCIFITFICYKIRKKIFEIILSILFIISFFLPHSFSCKSYLEDHNYFNIEFLFGETCSITFTHLFINYYFLGFLIGFALFYNNDITNENSLNNSTTYKPFNYLKDLIGLMFKSPNWVNILIIVLTVGIQLLLCISFIIYTNANLNYDELKNLNGFDHYLYLNERTFFSFTFAIFITLLYTYKNESKLKEFGKNIFVILFNRIGYGFYAIIEAFVDIIFAYFKFVYSLNVPNFIFSTFGIIFFLAINNLFLFVLNELPMKMLIKKLQDNSKKEEKI